MTATPDAGLPPVQIKACMPADVETLAQVAAATFIETFGHLYAPQDLNAFLSGPRSKHSYAKMLQDPTVNAWLALDAQGRAVGYAIAGPCKLPVDNLEPTAGELRELYVRASHQKHRIGSQLLTAALDTLRQRHRTPLYIGVWSENLGAQKLYRRFGFQKIGEYDFPVGDHIDREFILKQAGAADG